MLAGMNVHGDGRVPASDLASAGVKVARMVLYPNIDLRPIIQNYANSGIDSLLLIARESHGGEMGETFDANVAQKWIKEYAYRYGSFPGVRWQWGNETDHVSPSSWSLDRHDFEWGLQEMRKTIGPRAYLVTGGLVSGDPSYLDGVDLSSVNAISVHPYGQAPDGGDWNGLPGNFGQVGTLLARYRAYHPHIVVSEIGVSTNECSEQMQARYCTAMMKALDALGFVDFACWFCWEDSMVDGFGVRYKPAYTAYRDFCRSMANQPVDWRVRCLTVAAKVKATKVGQMNTKWKAEILKMLMAP